MKTCADAILAMLEDYDVDTVFGIPGVHTIDFYAGFASSRIRHVTPRHEQAAAQMAYGYALSTGRPGVCLLITGPGLVNALSAVGEAYANSVPMLVLAADNLISEIGLGEGRLHETPAQVRMAEQVTAFTHLVLDRRNLPGLLARAFGVFAAQRPRPVCINLPRNLASEPADFPHTAWPLPRPAVPDGGAIAEAWEILRTSKRPMMLLGGGAGGDTVAATALAEKLDIPVVTSIAGKGIVPEDHALSLGAGLPFAPVQAALQAADVVLAVGTEMSETDALYSYSHYQIDGRLIRIDIEPAQLARGFRPHLPIVGDAAEALRMLLACVAESNVDAARSEAGAVAVARLKRAVADAWLPGAGRHMKVLDRVRKVLPTNGIVSCDSTQIGYTGCHYYPSLAPDTWLFPVGYGALGSGLPVAIGAKLGAPERAVVAIAGDGGFLYTIEELAAAVEQGLALPVIVWDSGGYAEIADEMDRKGVPRVGVDFPSPDFLKIASGFRCHSEEPGSLDQLEAALRAALMADRPTVIRVAADASYLDQ
jgi:thiamine pyrophosphate-dependent acetolactate synthase large subunit-like protein